MSVVINGNQSTIPVDFAVLRPANQAMKTGSITVGGTQQTLLGGNKQRKGWFIQNTSSADIRVNDGGNASNTAGIKVPAGAIYETPKDYQNGAQVSVWGATTGQTFTYGEW